MIAVDCDKAAFEGEEQRRLIAEHKDRLIPVQGTHTHTHAPHTHALPHTHTHITRTRSR